MNRLKFLFLRLSIICVFIISCDKEKFVVKRINQIAYEHHYLNGEFLDSIYGFEKDTLIYKKYPKKDSLYVMNFKNGEKISAGYEYKGEKIGNWNFYKNNKIHKTFEYVQLCNETWLNQGYEYSLDGYIEYEKSHFYKIIDNTNNFKINQQNQIQVYYKGLYIENKNLIKGFCFNIYDKPDLCLFIEDKIMPTCNQNIVGDTLKIKFSKNRSGKFYILGVIGEVYGSEENDNREERSMFFSIPINLVD